MSKLVDVLIPEVVGGTNISEKTVPVVFSAQVKTGYRFCRVVVLIILATIPIRFGAVQPWVWSVYTVMIFVAFMVFTWQKRREDLIVRFNGYTFSVGLFLLLTLFACLPLSNGIMGIMSPVRYALVSQTKVLTGMQTVWSTVSYSPFQSLGWWGFLLGMSLLYVMLKTLFRSRYMLNFTLWVLLGLAVVQGLYGLLQALIPNIGTPWISDFQGGLGEARGTWMHRNHFAGFMGMLVPLLLGFYYSLVQHNTKSTIQAMLATYRMHQHGLLLALMIAVLSLFFSKSMIGVIALFMGVGTFFILIRSRHRKLPRRYWIIAGFLISIPLFIGFWLVLDPIHDGFFALDNGHSRLDYWRDSLAMIADHPMGIGLAAFKYVFPVYNVTSSGETAAINYLHNDLLQTLVETGWPCFLLLTVAYLLAIIDSYRKLTQIDIVADPLKFSLAVGAFSGLVSITFHCFFDNILQIPANLVYFIVLLSMLRVCVDGPVLRKKNF